MTPARAIVATVLMHAGAVMAQPAAGDAPSRGQLLYEAHCIQCHTEQMHWRDARVARDWATLRAQVEAWQMRSGQRWTAEDVDAVARHLNTTIYHYPPAKEQADAGPARPVSAAPAPAPGRGSAHAASRCPAAGA